jgi:UMF1 family MFS transporter
LVGLPAPLIWLIDVERGKREGEKLVAKIEGSEVCASQEAFLAEDEEDL